MIAGKRELRIEIADRVGIRILLCEFVEGALVSGELIWRDAKHEALDGEVRREVLGIPVENAGGATECKAWWLSIICWPGILLKV
jgi:hypothetical protein